MQQAQADAERLSLPALQGPGWGFHDFDGAELLTARARGQIKILAYRALAKGPGCDGSKFPDGHVIGGVERVNAREFKVEIFFVAARPHLAVYLPTADVHPLMMIEAIPCEGFLDLDFEMKARAMGLSRAVSIPTA